jgi:hypothetical protein
MNKTQVVNCTENLIYCLGKHNIYNETEINYLNTAIDLEQVPPEMENRKFFCSFISGDTSHTSTIQHMKYKYIIQYLTS